MVIYVFEYFSVSPIHDLIWFGSPANIFAINEVPFKRFKIENMKVKRISFDAIKFTVTSFLWLSLVKIGLSSCFTI